MQSRFNYTHINGTGFKPEKYISIPYLRIPAILVRDVQRVLSMYSLDNFCTPTLNHLVHALLKFSDNVKVECTLEQEMVCRRRSFNIDIKYRDLLPDEQEDLERLFTGLFYRALALHKDKKLKKVLEM